MPFDSLRERTSRDGKHKQPARKLTIFGSLHASYSGTFLQVRVLTREVRRYIPAQQMLGREPVWMPF
jgi:hypothetical protein